MRCMRLNLFGGPCVGKTTVMLGLVNSLKKEGYVVENAREAIKDWAWLGRKPIGFERVQLYGEQVSIEERVLQHGIPVITDSPLRLFQVYRDDPEVADLLRPLNDLFDSRFPAINVLLKRSVPWDPRGRYQTYEEALAVDSKMREVLTRDVRSAFIEIDPVGEAEILYGLARQAFEWSLSPDRKQKESESCQLPKH